MGLNIVLTSILCVFLVAYFYIFWRALKDKKIEKIEEQRLATVLQAHHITSVLSQYKDQPELINCIKTEFNAYRDRVLTVGDFEGIIKRCQRKIEAKSQKSTINKIFEKENLI